MNNQEQDFIPRTPRQADRFLSDAQWYVMMVRDVRRDANWAPAWHLLEQARGRVGAERVKPNYYSLHTGPDDPGGLESRGVSVSMRGRLNQCPR